MITFKAFQAGIRIAPDSQFTTDPVTGKVGEIYWNTTRNVLRICVNSTPIWQDLFIHRDVVDDATLRWDIANDRWTQNTDLRINQSLIYTADTAAPLDLTIKTGDNSTALTDGASLILETGAGGAGAEKGIIRTKTRIIKGEDSLIGLDLSIESGDSSDVLSYGGKLYLKGGSGNPQVSPGQPEISTVNTSNDIAGSLIDKYFLFESPNNKYYGWMDTLLPGIPEETVIDFTGANTQNLQSKYFQIESADATQYYVWFDITIAAVAEEVDFTVNSAPADGTYFLYDSADATQYYVWFEVDSSGNDPLVGGRTAIPVSYTSGDSTSVIASALASALVLSGSFTATPSTNIVTSTDLTTGDVANASDFDSGVNINVIIEGADISTATDPVGTGVGVPVAGTQADTPATLAASTAGALQLTGSFTATSTVAPDTAIITDATGGSVTDAFDLNSGLSFSVTTQGEDSRNGIDPAIPGRIGVQITYTLNDVADDIAIAAQGAIDALGDVSATVLGSTVTITNDDNGAVDDASDGDVGFIVSVTQQGIDDVTVGGKGDVVSEGYDVNLYADNQFNVTSKKTIIQSDTDIDLNAIRIGIKAQAPTDPTTGEVGDFYYNTVYKRFRKHNGTEWTWWDGSAHNTTIALVDYKDDVLSSLPLTTATTVDGAVITDGIWVLFTNLALNNNKVYKASVSGIVVSWTSVVYGQSNSGTPTDGDLAYIKLGTDNNDGLYAYNGTEWFIVGLKKGLNSDNTLRWDGFEWSYNDTLNINDNTLYIRDNLASGDLLLMSGTSSLAVDGDITLQAMTGRVKLYGERIHIGAQYAGNPVNGEESDIFYDTDRRKLVFHDHIGYRDIDGGNVTKEFTGFVNRTDSELSFVNGTRTFTITPSTEYEFYIQGQRYFIDTPKSLVIPDVYGSHFIAFDGNTLITQPSFTPALLQDYAYVAYIYWDVDAQEAVIFGDERHGLSMDGATHAYLHNNLGMRLVSGLQAYDFDIAGDGSSALHAQLAITSGVVADEDINHSITDSAGAFPYNQVLSTAAELPVLYKLGVSNRWKRDAATTFPIKSVASVPQYNFFNTGLSEWELADVTDGKFFAMWVFATNDIASPINVILGQDEYDDLTTAQEQATYASMVFGDFPAQEIKAMYRLIFEYDTAFTNSVDVALRDINDIRSGVDFHLGGYTSLGDHGTLSGLTDQDHPASAIFTGTGTWGGVVLTTSETDVQLALNRLDAQAMKINMINVEKYAADPVVVGASQIYYDTINNLYKYYDGTQFKPLGGGDIVNSDRNCSLLGGGTVKWKASTDTLSWAKDAFFQVPGVTEVRNQLDAGSVVLPNDGDVAYVDINRTAGAPASLSVTVVNITALGITSPANENRFVFARRHAGDVYWGLQDGQRISSTDGGVLIEATLLDNTTGGLIFAEDATDNDTMIIKFSLKRGTAVEVGHLYVTNDGTNAGISGAGNELSPVGVTFQAVINGSDVEVRYDTTNTGTNVEMRYVVEKWDAS